MSGKRSALTSSQRPVVSVEPAALGTAELRALTDALADVAPMWTVELQGICVEEASLIVLPDGGDDMIGPSYALSRETFGYRVDQVHWDRMTEVGQYADFADAVQAIRHRVSLCVPAMVPAHATLH